MSGFKLSNPSVPGGVPQSPEQDRPLDLAVHSLPDPAPLSVPTDQRSRWGRWKMFLILLICAAPVVASYFTYYVIRPELRRHFGELIEPQRPLPDQVVKSLDGSVFKLRSLMGQWLLTSVALGQCEEPCQQRLYLQRQLRESLGKNKDRLDWVWIVSDELEPPVAIRGALETATVIRMPTEALTRWLVPAAGHAVEDHLYLVDPMGNLMMRFPAELDVAGAGKAKRDLERLMRASASWDLAGR